MKSRRVNVGRWVAGVAGAMLGVEQGHGQELVIDLDAQPIHLVGNRANQKFVLTASNQGGQSERLVGAYLTFQVGNGFADANVPAITAVDFITDTPWAALPSAHITSQTVATSPQFWTLQYFVNLAAPEGTSVTIPQGQFRLAEITFDTSTLESGSWGFVMRDVDVRLGFDSYFIMANGNTVAASGKSGSVTITAVPEPVEAVGLAALGLFGWRALRRRVVQQPPHAR